MLTAMEHLKDWHISDFFSRNSGYSSAHKMHNTTQKLNSHFDVAFFGLILPSPIGKILP